MTVNYFTNKKPKNNPLFSYLNLCRGAEPQVNVFKKVLIVGIKFQIRTCVT